MNMFSIKLFIRSHFVLLQKIKVVLMFPLYIRLVNIQGEINSMLIR